jgi:hypothetical protein
MDSEEFHVLGVEEKFQKTIFVVDDESVALAAGCGKDGIKGAGTGVS